MAKKSITFKVEEHLIQAAKEQASYEKKTLNEVFEAWLADYVKVKQPQQGYCNIMQRLNEVDARKN